jgi:hypothetical protein
VRRAALLLTAVAAFAAPAAGADGPARRCALATTIATGFPVSEERLLDVDGDGKADLLVVGTHGEVRVWKYDPATKTLGAKPVGSLVLRYPDRTLLAVADLLGGGARPQLVEMTKDGVFIHRVDADGAFVRAGELVAPRTKFTLRVGRPTFADIARDVNGDGRPDLVLPRGEECDLWLNGGPDAATGLPTFKKAASIKVDLQRATAAKSDALSDVLEESLRIPYLTLADVNGDGRRDLLVGSGKIRSWHLQREDGSFPANPDITLDLSIFRDTTPEAEVQLGRTLAGGDDQRLETRDLDGDGIPDYVIAHRRKVWVFHGTKAGPQFTEPSDVLRVADDVTAMLLVKLDGDQYPDLLLLRVQVPTIATLLRGLVAEWDIDVAALGYQNLGGKKFDTTPKWKGDVSVRLPALLGVIKNPEALIRRFEDVAKKFRRTVPGDFDGDGRPDVALVSEDGTRLELFTSRAGGAKDDDEERAIGDVFFGEEGKVWELDDILRWMSDFAERQASRHTGGGPPYAVWALRPEGEFERIGIESGDLGGDGRSEIVVAYDHGGVEGVFDVVRVE